MKPVISQGDLRLLTAGLPEDQAAVFRANVDLYPQQLPQLDVDQQRIGDRFLELLAAEQTQSRRRSGPDGRWHEDFLDRYRTLADQFRWQRARQAGKTSEMQHWVDKYEEVTGERPTTVRAQGPADWRMPDPWKRAGHTSGGGTVWVAPLGEPWPTDGDDPAPSGEPAWLTLDDVLDDLAEQERRDAHRLELLGIRPAEPESASAPPPRTYHQAGMGIDVSAPKPFTPRCVSFDD